ncbi:hypothetical protein [Flavobacterium sp.]|uniref:hypothetical protein n=1 Tax=Flavobacterium sp. TaxID=239 RepID=UPI003A9374F5
MRNPVQITIPQPCHEKWTEMTPTNKGRFCASCQKKVIDFTKVSDREIAQALKTNDKVCGRLYPSQLSRNLVIPKEKSTIWSAIAATIISFITIGCNNNKTQQKPTVVQTDSIQVKKTEPQIEKQSPKIKITVKNSNGIIEDATVINTTKNIRTSKNENGVYEIEASKNDVIEITCVFNETKQFTVTNNEDITIEMIFAPTPDIGEVKISTIDE